MDRVRLYIKHMIGVILAGFIVLCVMLTYWQVVAAPSLKQHPGNNRQEAMRKMVQPGRLLTADGLTILDSQKTDRGWERVYSDSEAFCHLTGYNNRSGLQKTLSDVLYARGRYAHPYEDLMSGTLQGNDVFLTVDSHAQELAHRLMDGRRGAVVGLDVASGALRVLYSSPTYRPAEVTSTEEAYNLFLYDPNKPEIDRPLQGLYPPGSVFKIFTAAAGIEAGITNPKDEFHCAGEERIAGTLIKCRKSGGHGELSLRWALADSCNITFAKLAERLGIGRFRMYANNFHILDAAILPLPTEVGRMADFTGHKGEMKMVEAAFGQGATMLTPLSVARLTATIARGGEVIQPYLVDHVKTPGGTVLTKNTGKVLNEAASTETCQAVAGMMRDVVEEGTGRAADVPDLEIAAKTGSAQNSSGEPHAWFTCFAPYSDPEIVVTVIVENGGSGGEVAGPVAVAVLRDLLNK